MTDAKRIVFLPLKRSVPQEIIDLAYKKVPPGFELELLDQAADSPEKIKRFAEADFILGYPGDRTEQEMRAATTCRLLQLMSAGSDRVLLPVWREMKVPVADNGGANAIPAAEPAVLLKNPRCSSITRCSRRTVQVLPMTPGSAVSILRAVIPPASRGVKRRPMSSHDRSASDAGSPGE